MKKLFTIVSALLMLTTSFAAKQNTVSAVSDEKDLQIEYSYEVESLDPYVESALTKQIKLEYGKKVDNSYVVIYEYEVDDHFALIPFSIFSNKESKVIIDNFILSSKAIIYRESDNNWKAILEDYNKPRGFIDKLDSLPEKMLTAVGKSRIKTSLLSKTLSNFGSARVQAQALNGLQYKFPWPNGVSYYYSQDWHTAFQIWAVDVGTTGSDRRTLASIDGTITRLDKCTDTTRMEITDDNGVVMGYMHLDTSSLKSYVTLNAEVIQGQLLGDIYRGSFNETCGFSGQNANSAHLHWSIPTNGFTADSWTITYPSNAWTKPGQSPVNETYTPSLPSTNVPNSGAAANCGADHVLIHDLYIDNEFTQSCHATQTMTVEDTQVTGNGVLNVSAGSTVYLKDGFTVNSLSSTGEFRAFIQ